MIEPKQLDALLHPQFDAKALKAAKVIGTGSGCFPLALPAARLYLPRKKPQNGAARKARRSFWFVWRPLLKILKA